MADITVEISYPVWTTVVLNFDTDDIGGYAQDGDPVDWDARAIYIPHQAQDVPDLEDIASNEDACTQLDKGFWKAARAAGWLPTEEDGE